MAIEYIHMLNAKKSNVSPLSYLLKRRKLLRLKMLHIQMMMALSITSSRVFLRFPKVLSWHSFAFYSGEWGSGAGKGGGSGGAVRDAGGVFGKMEAAREEEYFRKLQRKQLAKLKQHISEEISHHKKLIQQHKDAISRLEGRINELKSSDSEKHTENET